MSTFKEIRGQLIKSLSSDPSPAAAGDMWYNSTSQTLKGVINTTSWSSGGNMGTARYSLGASTQGTKNATIFFSGYSPPGVKTQTESYNGTSWSEVADVNTGRDGGAGAGTQTSALFFGGSATLNESETWNGSSWSEGNNLNTGRRSLGGLGVQTAALAFAGTTGAYQSLSEEYNGTSWTEGNNLSTARADVSGAGIQTAGLCFGGYSATAFAFAITEEYDGTSWTAGGDMSQVRRRCGGSGSQTDALAAGGLISSGVSTTKTELYNGTSWSEVAAIGSAIYFNASSGTNSNNSITGAGRTNASNSGLTATEEFGPVAATKTFTTS